MTTARVVVVGAGATGLAAACALVRRGIAVDLITLVAPRRSVVASSGDGIAAAADDDGRAAHAADAVFRGASASEAAAIRALVAAGPAWVDRLTEQGVPFILDDHGVPARRRASGHRHDRLVTAGPTMKRAVVEALDRELAIAARAHPALIRRLEGWEMIEVVVHEGTCVGVVAQDLRTMAIHAVAARAVLLASGGFAGAWSSSAAAPTASGSATAAALRAGAALAGLDAVDLAPLAIVGGSKRHAISDVVRAAGARVWVPVDAGERRRARDVPSRERRELLRPLDDAAGSLVEPGSSARAIARALFIDGAGVFDVERNTLAARAYVDLGHLGGALLPETHAEIDRIGRVTGVDLGAAPALVAPAIADTLGGLAVGFAMDARGDVADDHATNHATTLPGLYAAGSAAHAYHRASRLPGHRLLEALAGGELAARAMVAHCQVASPATNARVALEAAEREARSAYDAILERDGEPETRELRDSLGAALDAASGLAASPPSLACLDAQIDRIATRASACGPDDLAQKSNRGAPDVRRLEAMVLLARAVIATARARADAGATGDAVARVVVRLVGATPSATVELGRAVERPNDRPSAPEVAP